MQIKSQFTILIGLSIIFSCRCASPTGRQMPKPDLSALKDDVGTLPLSDDVLPAVMQALHYYTEMMQYEQLQNPSVQADKPATTTRKTTPRPTTRATTRRTTTTQRTTTTPRTTTQRTTMTQRTTTQRTTMTQRTTTKWTSTPRPSTTQRITTKWTTTPKPTTTQRTTTTTKRPTTWTTTRKPTTTRATTMKTTPQQFDFQTTQFNVWQNHFTTPRPHKPGNYAPEKPPYWMYFGIPMKPEQGFHRPGVQRPQEGINALSDPDWKDPAFVQWFFQPRPRQIDFFDENELQYLDPLPKKLLTDINREPNRLPALLDLDNVNEFRRKYDDSFYARQRKNVPNMQHMRMKMKLQILQQRQTLTGRKKPPPTRPYVHMLMLYDLCKREAKSKKLHQFGGFSPALLNDLHENSKQTGDLQMKYLLDKLLDRKEVTAADVLLRVNSILKDLNDEKSETTRTLRMIPPLLFLP